MYGACLVIKYKTSLTNLGQPY